MQAEDNKHKVKAIEIMVNPKWLVLIIQMD